MVSVHQSDRAEVASGTLVGLTPQIEQRGDLLQVTYQLELDTGHIVLSDAERARDIGLQLQFAGPAQCAHCEATTTRLYNRAYCFDCARTLARCDLCFVSPERCHYDAGTCREPQWADTVCMQPHVIYLANTSGPKVGITREGRQWRRWVDQGASGAMAIALAPSRRAAGLVEDFIRQQMSDRTDWRKLVSGHTASLELMPLFEQVRSRVQQRGLESISISHAEELSRVQWVDAPEPLRIQYPINVFSPARRLRVEPTQRQLQDNLVGVIGQYLLFSTGAFNVPEHVQMGIRIEQTAALAADELPGDTQLSLFAQPSPPTNQEN